MIRRTSLFLFLDLFLLFFVFLFFSFTFSLIPSPFSALFLIEVGLFSLVWILWALLFKKFPFIPEAKKENILFHQFKVNVLFFLLTYIFLIFNPAIFPRHLFAGYVFVIVIFESLLTYLYLLDKSLNRDMEELDVYSASRKVNKDRIFPKYDVQIQKGILYESLKNLIIQESNEEIFQYIKKNIPLTDKGTLIVSTSTKFNIKNQPKATYQNIVNLKNINDAQYVNKFFEEVNAKLNLGGMYLGAVETYTLRKKRILESFPPVLNWVYYFFDFLIKRVSPKLILTKKFYFYITGGRNRAISRAEILGRLYSCGFEVLDEGFIGNRLFYIARKIDTPKFDLNPTYGPLIKLRRYGKDKKIIGVYKMRTMHAYSEYLQAYIYEKNDLQDGGKFKDDFRITTLGRFMRKFWIDELPMLLNLLKGDMKLVGVRPLSNHYFELYTEELKEKRLKYKPGLIPPFYVDLPDTLEEIMASEMRYLEAYAKQPFRTDLKYFFLALNNILIKRARSK